MVRKTYLSIDLDYWHKERSDAACRAFFLKVFRLNLPIIIVDSHERLLPYVEQSGANVLVNVDYHSDFIGFVSKVECEGKMKRQSPEDGTWINFVQWRTTGEVHWMYPERECYGSCQISNRSGRGACWVEPEENPFRKRTYNEWQTIKKSLGTDEIEWDTVVAVGVALSVDYLLRMSWHESTKELNLIPFSWTAKQLGVAERILENFDDIMEGSTWQTKVESISLPNPRVS